MFRKDKISSKELDYKSLNTILKTGKKLINVFYFVIVIALLLLITYVLKEWKIFGFIGELLKVISPIFIGFLIAWLLDPVVDKIEARKVPRVVGCIIVYLIMIAVIALFLYLVIPNFTTQISDFISTLPDIIKDVAKNLDSFLDGISYKFGLDTADIEKEIFGYLTDFSKNVTTNLPTTLFNIGKGMVNGAISFVLGLMIGFYMLWDFDKIKHNLEKLMPYRWREGYHDLTDRLNNQLRKYIQGVFLVMVLVFITQSIGLTLAGLEAPLIFALFCAITDIIPYFGPYIGAIPAIIVGFTISPLTGICVIISIVIVQLLENNFYQPLIMGKTMSLHPITIIVGLLIFQHFFGIIGMVVATPVIACCKVIIKFINEKLGLLDRILGEKEEVKTE